MDWDSNIKKVNIGLDKQGRAVMEPILSSQFGEEALDDLF